MTYMCLNVINVSIYFKGSLLGQEIGFNYIIENNYVLESLTVSHMYLKLLNISAYLICLLLGQEIGFNKKYVRM